MDIIWLIYNPRSRTADEALVAEIEAAFAQAGQPIKRRIELGDGDLPSVAELTDAGVTMLAALSGDGSISALASALDGWKGALLVLPGGTMNLLSRALHGDAPVLDIVARVTAGQGRRQTVPTIEHDGQNEVITAYTGIVAGPTAAWGEVREDLRKGDLAALGQDAVNAVSATFQAPGVGLKDKGERYPALFLEPGEGVVQVSAVIVENPGHLLAHGWAWLMGDFRTGPFETLAPAPEISLYSSGTQLELLVDGEQVEAGEPATFRAGRSALHFVATQEGEPQSS